MGFFDKWTSAKSTEYRKADAPPPASTTEAMLQTVRKHQPQALSDYNNGQGYSYIGSVSFNGEKNAGELGPVRTYLVDHTLLRARSWQMYLESKDMQLIIRRKARWVIGKGLKLQSRPRKAALESEGIDIGETEAFNNLVEARFEVYSNTKGMADLRDQKSLNKLAKEAYINAQVGGDALVIMHGNKDYPKVQLVDGAHVQTPMNFSFDVTRKAYINPKTNNRVVHGVELDSLGRHVGYHIRKSINEWDFVSAYGPKSGVLRAWLCYGLGYRLDNVRGIPLIAVAMETIKKMDQYSDATLGSALERQKIAIAIVHELNSSGENPFMQQMTNMMVTGTGTDNPVSDDGKMLAEKVAATTNKRAINMPPGAKLESLDSKAELHYKDFSRENFDSVCGVAELPPDVARMTYNGSYSASRAALKDNEHTIDVDRTDFKEDFYQPIYDYWLTAEVLANKINAPGYLQALLAGNNMALAAYRNAAFVGARVPHIDPLKEVMAIRAKLGPVGANMPLTTLEAGTEELNGGDSMENLRQFNKEIELADELGINLPPTSTPEPPPEDDDTDK